ncbi:hypothetical protein ACFSKW_16960 [Nonomuraea mangrovi]|uniref:Uncharacterized protein n=1 Tax=Nonomuraea mangrovi TaxID=2316207 RepID=A0ABW4SUB2_9ACTN
MLRRSSLVLWALALALTALPYVPFLGGWSGSYAALTMGSCWGFMRYADVSMALLPLYAVPEPVIVLVGFGLWALLAWKGMPRWGRAAGWLSVLGITWPTLLEFGFAVPDLLTGDGCAQTWAPFLGEGPSILGHVGEVLPALLILVAVRVPRTTPRGGIARTAAAAFAVLLLLGLQTGDRARGKVTEAAGEKCGSWDLRYGPRPVGRGDRETAFVCVARGQEYVLPPKLRDLPDAELVAFGRNLCGASMRADPKELGRLHGETGVSVDTVETTQALALLCPEVDAREQAEEKRRQAENDEFTATAKKRCAGLPPHRPRIRAAVRGATSMWSDYGAVTAIEDEEPEGTAALDKAFGNDLVGAAKGELAILTADEAMHVCVTVEGYGRRPPVERKGWEKVVEIGYTSPKGELTYWAEAAADLPNPLVKGPGRYRVRVHMRGAGAAMKDDGDARQQFLVMIFPGSSRGTEVLR